MEKTDTSVTASAIRWFGLCLTPNSFCRRLTMETFERQPLYAGYAYANPPSDLARDYLTALRRQATKAREALEQATFSRPAIGGGTPTYLDESGLEALFDIDELRLYEFFGEGVLERIPTSHGSFQK